ncbi:MAG TPA: hypothetical protein PLV42_00670 [bacterium]|nr:hypothetical protein [bacterium]
MKRALFVLLLVLSIATAITLLRHGARTDERTDRYLASLAAQEPPGALPAPKERADWDAARVFYRTKLAEALGLDILPERALNDRVVGEHAFDRYRVSRLVFDSLPEIHGLADLYLPTAGNGPFAALLFIASSDDGAHDVAVLRTAATLAAAGTATLVLELSGCGDRRVTGRDDPALFLSGITPAGIAVWETRRLLEMLRHRPDIDPQRLAVAGAGGGGMTALYTAALDDTVATGAALLSVSGWGAMTEPPSLSDLLIFPRRDLEQHHILALIAPRPFIVVAGKKEGERTAAATETVRRARETYRFLGADERLEFTVAAGARRYQPHHRLLLYDFLTRRLGGGAIDEEEEELPARDLFPAPFDPARDITLAELARRKLVLLRDETRARRDDIGPELYAIELGEALRDLSGGGLFPRGVLDIPLPDTLLDCTGPDNAATAVIVLKGPNSRRIVSALSEARVATCELDLPAGDTVRHTVMNALVAGLPLAFLRAGDIMTVAADLARKGHTAVGLYAEGSAHALAALLAASQTDRIGWLALRDSTASLVPGIGDTEAIQQTALQIPRLLRTADIGDLVATLAPRPVLIAAMQGPDHTTLESASIRRLVWETRHLVIADRTDEATLVRFLITRGTTPTP